MAKLSNPIIPVTTDLTDGLVHMIVPDETSETGYTSKKIVLEDHIQPGGTAVWGEIEGTIQDQTDLIELIPDAQIQSDWNQADSGELDYIKNKPTIPTLSTIDYVFGIALAGLDADIAVKEGAAYCPCPENMTIQSVFISMTTAPTGANAIYDINAAGSTILSTKITIEAGEYSSLDATTQPVISDADIDKGEMFRIDCDQKGATVAGKNPVLIIIYRKR